MSTGRLLVPIIDGSTLTVWYSDDDGQTWGTLTGTIAGAGSIGASIAVSSTDEVILMWGGSGGTLSVRAGTISGTTITWGSDFGLYGGNEYGGDMCVYRVGSTTTWAHAAYWDAVNEIVRVQHLQKEDGGSWTNPKGTIALYSSLAYGEVSIDFHHTGDGQTVQSGTPHLYVGMRIASASSAYFRKLVYSAGPAWTANATRTMINSVPSSGSQTRNGPVLAFNGTDVFIAAVDDASPWITVAKRDAADTTTTSINPGALGSSTASGLHGITVDSATGNIAVWARSAADGDLYSNNYDGASWSGWTLRRADATNNSAQALRHRAGSPHAAAVDQPSAGGVYYVEGPSYNEAPTTPELENPSDGASQDVNASLYVQWVFHDPDPGDTQGAYSLRRQIGTASYSYWTGAAWTASESASTKISTSATALTLSSSWGSDGDDSHYYAVKTWDAADAGPSSWSLESEVIPSAKDNPTVTAITTVTSPTYDVTWTVATQTRYRVRVYDDSGGSPVTSTVFYDSGQQWSAVTSHSTPFPDNSVTRHVGVVTWNDEALMSNEDTEQLAVLYPVPPTPTVSMSTTGSEFGVIWVAVNNPTPGGGETVTDSNEIYRRVAAEGGDGIRVGQGIAEDGGFNDYGPLSEVVYQYRARAINAGLGTGAFGAWTT